MGKNRFDITFGDVNDIIQLKNHLFLKIWDSKSIFSMENTEYNWLEYFDPRKQNYTTDCENGCITNSQVKLILKNNSQTLKHLKLKVTIIMSMHS